MPQQITAWSYSRYSDYEQCPFRAKLKHVDKMREPGSPAMERGATIHKLAEDYASGRLKKLPVELKLFKDNFLQLKKSKVICEQEWAFDIGWRRVDWFAKEAWLRVKMDAVYVMDRIAIGIDHKTGKYKPGTYSQQLELYLLAMLLIYPDVEKVSCKLWFLDSGEQEEYEATRADLTELKVIWLKRTKPMLSDKRFAPKPGNHCRWCPFSKSKGGPCKF